MIALDQATRLMIAVILGLIGKRLEVKEVKKENELEDQDQHLKVDRKEKKGGGAQATVQVRAMTLGQINMDGRENDQDLTLEARPTQVAEALLQQVHHQPDLFTGKDVEKEKRSTVKIGYKFQLKILRWLKQQQEHHKQF